MIVRAIGGLANRLRVILSRPHDSFVWVPDDEVAGARFADVFECDPWIGISDDGSADYSTTDPSWELGGTLVKPGWIERYCLLVPVEPVRTRIAMLRELLGTYDAMHIRRTDSGALVVPDDDAFFEWAKGRATVYLATDNGRTQDKFREWLGPTLEVNRWIADKTETMPEGCGTRLTSLQDAVVDLYMCAHSSAFRGSPGSSFSQLVYYLKDVIG